jgi:hypothetical protein
MKIASQTETLTEAQSNRRVRASCGRFTNTSLTLEPLGCPELSTPPQPAAFLGDHS